MTVDEFARLRWTDPGEPLIEPPRLSPVIADPSFLFPEETPDGRWYLVAHSAWGLHRYVSDDGISWRDLGLFLCHGMRPFIRFLDGEYLLYYEAYAPFALPLTALPFRPPWRSALRLCRSRDLASWSAPEVVLEPSLDWMRDSALGSSVSNPCLASDGSAFRLYFSASLSWIPDCGFCEPRSIGVAFGAAPAGPFAPRDRPIVEPSAGAAGELGAGSLKALRLDDGWVALQNKIFTDSAGKSRSALFLLRSPDGLDWTAVSPEPLLAPGLGWTSSHVYACDVRRRPSDGRWYLYFNARDGWRISEGRERIGRIVGRSAPD